MADLAAQMSREHATDKYTFTVRPVHEVITENATRGLWMLLAATGLLLLIACTNVANLLLARAVVRERDLAIRASLGAGRRRLFGQVMGETIALGVLCASAHAQYPNKPVRLIVTYPPGGSSDLMSRVYGAKLAELWGQQVIIESKPGAAGSIGMDFAAKQPNDGYSFVVGNLGPVAVNPLLSKVPYSIEKDFIAVSMISTGPNVLVVRTDSPFRSLTEIISYARQNPGKLNYGTSGPGTHIDTFSMLL